jgi:hypothetical protein
VYEHIMGSASALLLLSPGQLRGRVLPALRAWAAGGEVAAWWSAALRPARRPGPDPADRMAWPVLREAGRPDAVPGPGAGSLVPRPDRALDEKTPDAVGAAVLTATADDGLA